MVSSVHTLVRSWWLHHRGAHFSGQPSSQTGPVGAAQLGHLVVHLLHSLESMTFTCSGVSSATAFIHHTVFEVCCLSHERFSATH